MARGRIGNEQSVRIAMNVLVVAPEWPPEVIGGGGEVYRIIARHLKKAGHQVTVLYGGFSNRSMLAAASQRDEDGLKLWRIPLLPTPKRLPWLRSALPPSPRALTTLRWVLRQHFDVAHLHGVGFPLVDLCARELRKKEVPYVLTVHGFPESPVHRGPVWRTLWQRYYHFATQKTIVGAKAITAVSKSLLQSAHVNGHREIAIYNGLPAEAYVRCDHVVPPSKPRLLSISRLSRNKGLDVAIKAVHELLKDGLDVSYDLYGTDGGEEHSLRQLIRDLKLTNKVTLRGDFLPSERSRIFSNADILLVPSRVEAFGLAALEGLAAGLPVVATRVGGLAEFLSDDCAVMTVSDDVGALSTAIKIALQIPLRAKITSNGLVLAERYRWEAILPEYERVLTMAGRSDR